MNSYPAKRLFSDGILDDFLRGRKAAMHSEISEMSESDLLNTDAAKLAEYLAEKYRVTVPEIDAGAAELEDRGEVQVDVSHEYQQRAIMDPSRPAYVAGRSVVFHLPFTGPAQLFTLMASTRSYNPPRANIGNNELSLPINYPSDNRPDLKAETDLLLRGVTEHLRWQEGDIDEHNRFLLSPDLATTVIPAA